MNRLNLHEEISSQPFQHAIISTFSFDPVFFEEYCLVKFNSLKNNPNITVFIDSQTYEKAITEPEQHRPKQANLRYLLHPIKVPGVFHPKIFMFLNKKKGKLIIGSANFTRPGITSNAELVNSYEFDLDKNIELQWLFQAAFRFFLEIGSRWPSEGLNSNLQAITREIDWLTSDVNIQNHFEFLHNLKQSLWNQIIQALKPPVESVWILSRYFDAEPGILDKVMKDLKPKTIHIYTQNGITTLTEKWMEHPLVKTEVARIYLTEYKDNEQLQNLHAKALYVKSKKNCAFLFGSANFTSPAMLKTAEQGNLETVAFFTGNLKIQPNVLFDPLGTAIRIKSKEILRPAPQEDPYSGKSNRLFLQEIILADNKLKITVNIPEDINRSHLFVKLRFQNEATKSLKLFDSDDGFFEVTLEEGIIQRLSQSSTIARIEVLDEIKGNEISNWLLVTNLLDICSGQSLRRERHFKEAQQSAGQFFQVLNDLISGNDQDALKTFLTFCDIPLLFADRPRSYFTIKPNVYNGMRKPGKKDIKIFESLHEASISFFDRHFKKLNKHVEFGGLKGIGNFMHIWLAMGRILKLQIETALFGFEAKDTPMNPEEWKTYRDYLGMYFNRFELLMNCLWDKYLHPLTKEYSKEKIQKGIEPDLEPMMSLNREILSYRDQIDFLKKTKLKVITPDMRVIEPNYFSCILDDQLWKKYEEKMKDKTKNIEEAVGF